MTADPEDEPAPVRGAAGRDGVLDQQRTIHRADRDELLGLVVDEQERRVLRREEMVGDRVAHGGTGHQGLTFWEQGFSAAEVSSHHGDRQSPDSGDLHSG
jgi:hypothetical protein